MKYYLDTNIIIYFIKGTYPSILSHISKVHPQSIVIPSIVKAEIEYGARKSKNYEKTIKKYRDFLNNFQETGFNYKESIEYGKIRSDLEMNGTMIGPNDLIIASTVLCDDGILVTHNTKEFERIKGLRIEDWTI